MSSNALKTYLAGAALFLAGFLLSLRTGDWSWFARSGSAVVALGILLTSHEIIEHYDYLREHQRQRDERAGRAGTAPPRPPAGQDWASKNSIRELIRARRREESIWESEFHGLRMLVVGTLVWGFGDLIGRIV